MEKIFNNIFLDKGINCELLLMLSQIVFDQTYQSPCGIIKYLDELKSHDEYTYMHSLNTAFYCMLISKWMGLVDRDILMTIQAGLLHDIGKADIQVELLNKKSSLTSTEFDKIKEHAMYGYKKIEECDRRHCVPKEVKDAILLHHERIDGSGYPFHFIGEELSIITKIVAVADTYDAMTSERIYKKKSSHLEAFQMFRTIGRNAYDKDICDTLIYNVSRYYEELL